MTPADLKYLPACEVKDILDDKRQTMLSKSARISPAPPKIDQFGEVGIKVQERIRLRLKQTVAPDIKFDGPHIVEFSKRTFREHSKLSQDHKTD